MKMVSDYLVLDDDKVEIRAICTNGKRERSIFVLASHLSTTLSSFVLQSQLVDSSPMSSQRYVDRHAIQTFVKQLTHPHLRQSSSNPNVVAKAAQLRFGLILLVALILVATELSTR